MLTRNNLSLKFNWCTFSNVRSLRVVRATSRLCCRKSTWRCRGGGARCTRGASAWSVSSVTRWIEPSETSIRLVTEIALRPYCNILRPLAMSSLQWLSYSEKWHEKHYIFAFFNCIICTEKNSLVNFIELFKSWGYRHLRNRVLENLQNFTE